MRKLLKVLSLVIGIMVALIIITPFILPIDAIFTQITNKVEQTTNRKLSISGDKTLSVFPELKLELNDVRFSNMGSSETADMVTMKQLTVNIPWLSLLSGEFKLEKFVINEPNVLLEKNASGEANWDLFSHINKPIEDPKDTPNASINSEGNTLTDFDIKLGEVAVYGGKLTYRDMTTNTNHEIKDFNLIIELPSLYKPLNIKGAVSYMSQKFELNSKLSTPIKAITSQDFTIESDLNSELVSFNFKGGIKEANKVIEGALAIRGDSLKDIIKWQNIRLESKDNAFNEFSFSGGMLFTENKLQLSNLNAQIDKLNITGQSEILLGKRMKVSADVNLGALNLNPYMAEQAKTETQKEPDNKKAEPIVWDETQIDLSALNTLDANIKVQSQSLQLKDIKLGENAFTFNLNKGIAEISMDNFNAYQGKGQGKAIINAKQLPYIIETNFALTAIEAVPLLTDSIKFDKLSGAGSIDWQLTAKGVNQKELINNLDGRLSFAFEDGAIKGANIAAMVRSAQAMLKGDFSKAGLTKGFDKSVQTDFAELSGIFNFQQGKGVNKDFKLFSPLIRITGKGKLDLPNTKIDYGVTTGLVSSIEGQGTTSNATGFKIPVRVKGPFHDVSIKLDVSSASKEKLKNKVKDKLKSFFG